MAVDEDWDENAKHHLKESFKAAAEEIHNKELAALMGEIDPDHPDTLPGGIMSVLGLTNAKLDHIKKKKRDKQKVFQRLMREVIRDAIAKLNEIIEQHQQRMAELLEQIEKADRYLRKLDEHHDLLEHELEHFQDHGVFDLDRHGHFRHEKAEAMIATWEEKTGLRIDRSDPASYEAIFNILIEIEEERIQLRRDLTIYSAEYEFRKAQVDQARSLRDDLQSGDLSKNQNALLQYQESFNDLKAEFRSTQISDSGDSFVEYGEKADDFDIPQEEMDGDFSFGFPPLQESFGQAVSDQNRPDRPSVDKSNEQKDKPLPINLGG